jgi:membrane fusion protein (multidrug efflux system)
MVDTNQGVILPSQFSATTRSLASDNFRYALLAWLLAAILLASWLLWFCFSTVTVYEVSAKAHLEVKNAPHPVAALVASKVIAAPLAIGQEVQAGAVLVELDARSERFRLQEELARLAGIAPRIASIDKEIAALDIARTNDQRAAVAAVQAARLRGKEAGASLEFAEENARRLKEESEAGSIARIDAMRALAEAKKLAAAAAALAADAQRLELEALTRANQVTAQVEGLKRAAAALEADQAAAEAAVQGLRADIEKHVVRAPVAGRIGDALVLRAGTYVAAGQTLATVVPKGDLIIVAEFNPASVLGRVRPGQQARLRLDGFPWTQYGSIGATVGRAASEVRDGLVRIELVPALAAVPEAIVQHGLPGTVEISLEQVPPAVLMLRAAGQWLAPAAQARSAP